MSLPFSPPRGIAFYSQFDLSLDDVCETLGRVVAFLEDQQRPTRALRRYDDWWEHDGLHFERGTIKFQDVFAMTKSPRSLLEETPDDDAVCIGVAPDDFAWYLRMRGERDGADQEPVGRFALILPPGLAEAFRTEIGAVSKIQIFEEDSESYYQKMTR